MALSRNFAGSSLQSRKNVRPPSANPLGIEMELTLEFSHENLKSTISLDENFPWPCLIYKVEYFALNCVDKSFTSRVLLIFKRLSTYHVWSVIIQYQFSHLLVHG